MRPATSWWRSETPEPDRRPPTALPDRADVVVVGGGLTGLTTALQLGKAGADVVLLEARSIGAGTTGASTAKVSLLQGSRLSTLSSKHPRERVEQYVEANREGQAWLRRFCGDHDVRWEQRTAVSFAATESGRRQVEKESHACLDLGLPVSSPEHPADTALPFAVRAEVRLAEQGQVDPMAVVRAIADQAEAHGVRILEDTRVRRIGHRSPVRVRTERGDIAADRVVVATNMPIVDRSLAFARLHTERSYSVALGGNEGWADALPRGMYLGLDDPARSLRTTLDHQGRLVLLVGGNDHRTGTSLPASRHLEDLTGWATATFPGGLPLAGWSAQDQSPAGGLPLVGPALPASSAVLVATGFAKWGMTNGVAAALALTARITGGQVPWADAFDPWWPLSPSGAPSFLGHNATVGALMGRDWAGAALATATRRERTATCTHLGGRVRWNDVERSWDCPLHGSRFDADGEVLEAPATCGLRHVPTAEDAS